MGEGEGAIENTWIVEVEDYEYLGCVLKQQDKEFMFNYITLKTTLK